MRMLFNVNKKKRRRGVHTRRRKNIYLHWKEALWPSMGWLAMLRWNELRIKRDKGSLYFVSMGCALGMWVNFTPFLGFHLGILLVLCYVLRASMIAAFAASLIGNPWTFPFIFTWTYNLGNFILHNKPADVNLVNLLDKFSWENIGQFWEYYYWPMIVGGIPTGIVAGAVAYALVYMHLLSYRKARSVYLARRRKANEGRFRENILRLKEAMQEQLVLKDKRRQETPKGGLE